MWQVMERIDKFIGDPNFKGPLEWVYIGPPHSTEEKAQLYAADKYGVPWQNLNHDHVVVTETAPR